MKTVLDTFKKEDYELYKTIREYNNLLLEREEYAYDESITDLSEDDKRKLTKKRLEIDSTIKKLEERINKTSSRIVKKSQDKINDLNVKLLELDNEEKDLYIKGLENSKEGLKQIFKIKDERKEIRKRIEFLKRNQGEIGLNIDSTIIFDNIDLLDFKYLVEENNKLSSEIDELYLEIQSLKLYSNEESEKLNQGLTELNKKYNKNKEKATYLYDKLFRDEIIELKKEIGRLEDKRKTFANDYPKEIIDKIVDQIFELKKQVAKIESLDKYINLEFLNNLNQKESKKENFIVSASPKKPRLVKGNSSDDYEDNISDRLEDIFEEPKKSKLEDLLKKTKERDVQAIIDLADAFAFGDGELGVPKNEKYAFKLYQEAISLGGKGYCEYALGCYYYLGINVEQDLEKALEYYEKSQEHGYDCQENIEEINIKLNDISSETIQNAIPLGEALQKNDSEQDLSKKAEKIVVTDKMHELLVQLKKFPSKSEEIVNDFIETACKENDIDAIIKLSDYYSHGLGGVIKNQTLSFKLLQLAVELGGKGYCEYELGTYYYEGKIVNQDLEKVLEYYEKAQEHGFYCQFSINAIKEELSNETMLEESQKDNSKENPFENETEIVADGSKISAMPSLENDSQRKIISIKAIGSNLKDKLANLFSKLKEKRFEKEEEQTRGR